MSHMKNYLIEKLESAPRITIGKITIQILDSETVWIQSEKEGGAFSVNTIEKILTDFFESNF